MNSVRLAMLVPARPKSATTKVDWGRPPSQPSGGHRLPSPRASTASRAAVPWPLELARHHQNRNSLQPSLYDPHPQALHGRHNHRARSVPHPKPHYNQSRHLIDRPHLRHLVIPFSRFPLINAERFPFSGSADIAAVSLRHGAKIFFMMGPADLP